MGVNMNPQQMFKQLQVQIDAAEKAGKPITDLVQKQIAILKDTHDVFVKEALENGYQLTNQKLGEIEVRQYSAMKQLAQKVGLPVEEYDEYIKKVRIRVFGEENYKRFFEEQ